MFSVEVYAKVRRAVLVDGMTRREAARIYGVHRNTISKMLAYPVPPGYRRKAPRVSVKLTGFTEHIDAMIEGLSQVAALPESHTGTFLRRVLPAEAAPRPVPKGRSPRRTKVALSAAASS